MATHISAIPLDNLYRLLAPITVPTSSSNASFINWGRTFECKPLAVFEPESEFQCQLVLELARREGRTVRAVGVGHSPSDLACTKDYMLTMKKMKRVIEVNREKRYILAEAGITLTEIHSILGEHGLAMTNMGSISDQTLAGVITTASHGTGINYGVMSTQVMALTLLLADGSRVVCSRNDNVDLFKASLCGLGSTGLITAIQLEVEPSFRLEEIQETRSFDDTISNLDQIAAQAEHVRLWWFPAAGTIRVGSFDRTRKPRSPASSWLWHSLLGHHLIQFLLFIGRYLLFVNVWVGHLAAWLIRDRSVIVDDSYAVFNLDCRYPQHTTEWAIPFENAKPCINELRSWIESEFANPSGLRPHFPIEIRFSAADDIWLSPSNGRLTCWIGIIQYKPYGLNVPYRKLFERFEAILIKNRGRPHWAKAHQLRPDELRKLYPKFDDFVDLLGAVDPHGLFRNEYVERHIFGKEGPNFHGRIFRRTVPSALRFL